MSLARWDPFLQLTDFEKEMNRLLRRSSGQELSGGTLSTAGFAPPVDIYDDENKITLKIEVPGIKRDDLDIRVDGNILTVSGERRLEQEEKKENFRRVERSYGSFTRSFTLPSTADTNNIEADFNNGVLQIDVPKRAESRGKRIKIGERSSPSEQNQQKQQSQQNQPKPKAA